MFFMSLSSEQLICIFAMRIDVFYGNKHSLVALHFSIGGFKGLLINRKRDWFPFSINHSVSFAIQLCTITSRFSDITCSKHDCE